MKSAVPADPQFQVYVPGMRPRPLMVVLSVCAQLSGHGSTRSGDAGLTIETGAKIQIGPTRTTSPKETADALDMDVLLAAFRRFVAAESVLFPTSLTKDAGREKSLTIDRRDCTCSECGGSLGITDVDDCTMSVECENGHEYVREHDAFDAGFDYVLDFLSRRRVAE